LVKKGKPGIIGIPPYLSNDQIDELLTKFVSGKNPEDFIGKAVRLK